MKRLLMGAAFAAGLAMAGGASAANLLTDGSFESGNLSAWTYTGTNAGAYPATVINYNSPTPYPTGAFGEAVTPDNAAGSGSPDAVGDHAAYFVADNATEELSQTIHLLPGIYTIGFSAYVPLNGFNNPFNATFDGSVVNQPLASFTVDGSSPQTWVSYAGVANVTTEGDYTTRFIFASGGPGAAGDVVIDRVYVVAGDVTGGVPEPATWAMMLMGFGGLGAVLRRRRSQQVACAAA